MPAKPRSSLRRALAAAVAAAMLAALLGACGGAESPSTSFDPTAPCPAQGQQPGAFPELEAQLPADYEGKAPDSVDSGRLCSADALGTLAAAGIGEVRFAGATWRTGGTSGLTLALFTADGLDATKMLEFYAVPAESDRHTEKLQRSDTTVGDRPAKRLDVLGSDGRGQTVVTWQDADGGPVRVLLAADLGDANVLALLQSLGSR